MEAWELSAISADEAEAIQVACNQYLLNERCRQSAREGCVQRPRRGSVRGRRPNRPRGFDAGVKHIELDYFGFPGVPPLYGEEEFERRFHVPRGFFDTNYKAVRDLPFWKQSTNRRGRGSRTLCKRWWPPSASSRTARRMTGAICMCGSRGAHCHGDAEAVRLHCRDIRADLFDAAH